MWMHIYYFINVGSWLMQWDGFLMFFVSKSIWPKINQTLWIDESGSVLCLFVFFFLMSFFLQLFIVWDYFFSNYILQHVFQQKTKFNVKKNNSQHSKFLIKTPLEHSTQTIFEGSSPWATLIFNSMFVVWVLCCVKLFSWLNIFINCVMCSFSLAFLFYLLSSILLDVSKCLISHNIGCLIKTLLIKKTAPKQLLKG
jgi:hypothetical protein